MGNSQVCCCPERFAQIRASRKAKKQLKKRLLSGQGGMDFGALGEDLDDVVGSEKRTATLKKIEEINILQEAAGSSQNVTKTKSGYLKQAEGGLNAFSLSNEKVHEGAITTAETKNEPDIVEEPIGIAGALRTHLDMAPKEVGLPSEAEDREEMKDENQNSVSPEEAKVAEPPAQEGAETEAVTGQEAAPQGESQALADESILDNMADLEWDGPDDGDEEIEGMAAHRMEWEAGVKFSRRGIMKRVEDMIRQEGPNSDDIRTAKLWEQKLKTPQIKYYLKKGGSELNSTQPFFRCEMTFNKAYKMDKLIKFMYYPEYQVQYDKSLIGADFTPFEPGVKTFGYSYTANKKIFTFDKRDFYEKGFNFYSEGKFYRYSSAVLGNEDLKVVPAATVRGCTLYNFGMLWRDPEDGNQIKFILLIQCDWKLKIPAFIYSTFLPKATKEWYNNVCKFYQKNHKKLE